MNSRLYRLGRFSATHPWRVIAGWLMAILVIAALSIAFGEATTDNLEVPGTPSQHALDQLEERFPDQAGGRAVAVFATSNGRIDDPANEAAIRETLGRIAALDRVHQIIDPFGPAAPILQSPDGTVAYAQIIYDAGVRAVPKDQLEALFATADPAHAAGIEVGYGGQIVERTEPEQARTSEIIGLIVAVIVLLVAFGSVFAMVAPLVGAILGVGVGLLLIRLLATGMDVISVAPTMASMIGIAVGIDYALFVVTRHRQHLADGLEPTESIGLAIHSAGRSVIFAGVTVMISMLGLTLVGIPLIASMGVSVAITVAAAVLVAITFLPAMLGLVGTNIDRLRTPFVQVRAEVDPDSTTAWSARWARAVTSRPWAALAVGVPFLLVLAIPALSLRTGWPDARNRPEGSPPRVAFDLLTDGFGIGANAPLLVVIDLTDAEPDAAETITTRLADLPQVQQATPALPNEAGTSAIVQVTPSSGPEDEATADLVRAIRAETDLEDDTGAQIEVTGATAFYIDISERLNDRLPIFIAAVVLLSFVLLTAVFRAPVVAAKAAAMNLLGISAAYGVIVAVFQWGWAKDLIGLEQTVPIISFLPMALFAVLFGLSMDYEVFILSRVREAWLTDGDNTKAIVHGLTASARVITAAAAIMFAVFASFVAGDSTEIKMFGLGLAVAVLLDATVIRLLLVPATMRLLGDANWWIPRWLDRILPNLDIEGAEPTAHLRPPDQSAVETP
ncbi:MMPL family transporter [Aquihabitans sp. G128]|uniref:MMPL family transporter n=1 Tax=Aquihabitans sp. G128 TaxID=2849779 RepID=UPI001C24A2EA|nr:MMPL family transporter [Aquihabitans sp. G128]QXC60479.1 MMPL family transporter [Aquihabitans sp. G128]HWJ63683.1 MMPL family transporter [Acidimicrobiales bacterium]